MLSIKVILHTFISLCILYCLMESFFIGKSFVTVCKIIQLLVLSKNENIKNCLNFTATSPHSESDSSGSYLDSHPCHFSQYLPLHS